MTEQKEFVYEWIHPDVIRSTGSDGRISFAFRNWVAVTVVLDTFHISRTRNFLDVDGDEILTSYKLDQKLAAFEAMSDADKAEFCKPARRLSEISGTRNPDGDYLQGRGSFSKGDTIFALFVDNFEGKRSEPWTKPKPRQMNAARVQLAPSRSKASHGGLYRFGDHSDLSLSLPLGEEVLSGILADLNSSSERKTITIRSTALLFRFENSPDFGEPELDDRSPDFYLMPSNTTSVPAILNSIDLVLYDRREAVTAVTNECA